jgi:predicted secreted hydrolase
VQWEGGIQHLEAVAAGFAVRLRLRPEKPPVIHGIDGVSQKAAGAGRASHYISLTRLAASGEIEIGGHQDAVEGSAWMDHEFFTHQLDEEQTGWDWFSIQLDDGTDLMLYRLRRVDGNADPFSAGTVVDARGDARHLAANAFTLQPAGRTWRSPRTGGDYPLAWRISVPSLDLSLDAATPLDQQEIVSSHRSVPSYWEGAIRLSGRRGGRPVSGTGYLEMTGYDRAVRLQLGVTSDE